MNPIRNVVGFELTCMALALAGCGAPTGDATGSEHEERIASALATPVRRCEGKEARARERVERIWSGGRLRAFRVFTPSSYDPTVPMPVVLNFHGNLVSSEVQEGITHMSAKSEEAGFVLVYPEGGLPQNTWNGGSCCGALGSDDVRFVADLLDRLEDALCVDTDRIYATGYSAGAFMAHRLACELSDRIAAVAPVSGVLGVRTCAPPRPVPVLAFHGTADRWIAYDGNRLTGWPGVRETIEGWARRNRCEGEPKVTFAVGDTRCVTYDHCAAGSEVSLCTTEGAGHTWPGGDNNAFLFGATTQDLRANDVMWTFFQKHARPAAVPTDAP